MLTFIRFTSIFMTVLKRNKNITSFTNHNKLSLIKGGKDYFDILEQLIDNAKQVIHLQTYIFDYDETGQQVANALIRAAARKVKVYVVLDGYASQNFPKKVIEEFEGNNIHFCWFSPLLQSRYFYFGRRLHHKVLVVDGQNAVVAGINISNRYNDIEGNEAWLDWAICAQGEVAIQVSAVCKRIWDKGVLHKKNTPAIEPVMDAILPVGICKARVRENDWVRRKNEISANYISMLRNATHQVIIMSSYFLPGRKIRKSIDDAVKRGVKIIVITSGQTDVPVAKYAEKHIYSWLLKRNIELFEYRSNVLHGKISVSDSSIVTIGSYNLNNISAYASIELNIEVQNQPFAIEVENTLMKIVDKSCDRITSDSLSKSHNLFSKGWYWLCYHAIRLIVYLFTFYFKHHKE